MKKTKKIFLILFLYIILVFTLTGCNSKPTEEETKSKVTKELDYLDTKIVSISNKLNNLLLQNYIITSEEIQNEKESSNKSSEKRRRK